MCFNYCSFYKKRHTWSTSIVLHKSDHLDTVMLATTVVCGSGRRKIYGGICELTTAVFAER